MPRRRSNVSRETPEQRKTRLPITALRRERAAKPPCLGGCVSGETVPLLSRQIIEPNSLVFLNFPLFTIQRREFGITASYSDHTSSAYTTYSIFQLTALLRLSLGWGLESTRKVRKPEPNARVGFLLSTGPWCREELGALPPALRFGRSSLLLGR